MNFIYTGTFGAGFIMLQEVCELSLLADRYDVAGLLNSCECLLKASLRVNNAAQILELAHGLHLPDLKHHSLDFVLENPAVMDPDGWAVLTPSLCQEVAEACVCGRRRKRRREENWEFSASTDWNSLTIPQLQRALAERGLAQDGDVALLIERLQS